MPCVTARIFWYSQTGHSYACALKAAETLQKSGCAVSLTPLAQAEPAHFQADRILFAFPVNNFKVPVPMVRLLQRLPVVDAAGDAFAIITYAGLPANTAYLFERLLAGKNLRLRSFVKIRCRDSFIPFVKWLPFMNATGKPDAGSLARVEQFVRAAMIEGTDRRRPLFNPFNLAHWMGQGSPDDGPKMFLGERIFLKEACVLCGQCAALCPSGAITLEAGEIRCDEKLCVGCCGCLNICPENAWRSSRFGPEYYNEGLHVPTMAEALGTSRTTPL
ncbi:MAG: EFR1 family ferrodoxin [Candidatus Methylomirabilia bacterium]